MNTLFSPGSVNDDRPDERAKVLAAALETAKWAHRRRATWTDTPLPAVSSAVDATSPGPMPADLTDGSASQPKAPSTIAKAAGWIRARRFFLVRGLVRTATVVVVLVAAAVGGQYVWTNRTALVTRAERLWRAIPSPQAAVAILKSTASASRPPTPPPTSGGGLRVTSTPAGAQVFVDDASRGATPLTLTGLAPGQHVVELRSASGTVRRTVNIEGGGTTIVDELIFSGWLTVYSSFETTVSEGGRVLRADDRNQIRLSAGMHQIRIVNQAMAFDVTRQVEVKPGDVTVVNLEPSSTIAVRATGEVSVWIDGAPAGHTPMSAVSAALGTHQILVKDATGAERHFTVTVTATPYVLDVDAAPSN